MDKSTPNAADIRSVPTMEQEVGQQLRDCVVDDDASTRNTTSRPPRKVVSADATPLRCSLEGAHEPDKSIGTTANYPHKGAENGSPTASAMQSSTADPTDSPLDPSPTTNGVLEKNASHYTIISSSKENLSPQTTTIEAEAESTPWTPSFLRIGPLIGLAALLFAFLQIFASYAVLKASHGDAVTNWKYQPNVYLAILAAISNKALSFAVVQGSVITWWLRALHGTTVAQLHRDWAYGLHVYKAMLAGRHFNMLALACICATFVAVDGPLLQRASTVHSRIPEKRVPLSIAITPEVPAYFSGSSQYDLHSSYSESFSEAFLPIVKDYARGTPITAGVKGCSGTCNATVRAPALALDHCQSTLLYINYTEPLSPEEERVSNLTQMAPYDRTVFSVGVASLKGTGAGEQLILETALPDKEIIKTCAGRLNHTLCYLVSAVAEYDILINGETITFPTPPNEPNIVRVAKNTAITNQTMAEFGLKHDGDWTSSTLSGIALLGGAQFGTIEGFIPPSTPGGQVDLALGDQSWFAFQHIANYQRVTDYKNACGSNWIDPMPDVMANLNEIMFRTGVHTARVYNETWLKSRIDDGLEIYYNVSGMHQSPVNVFESDFNYFAGAAAVELFSILAILFTYYGWWRLGRAMSFSPLEIAKVPLCQPRRFLIIPHADITCRHLTPLFSKISASIGMGSKS